MGLQIRTVGKATDDDYQKITDTQLAFLRSDATAEKPGPSEEIMGRVYAGIKVRRTATNVDARDGTRRVTLTATATEGVADLFKLLEQSK